MFSVAGLQILRITHVYNAVSVVVFHFRASGIDLAGNRDVH